MLSYSIRVTMEQLAIAMIRLYENKTLRKKLGENAEKKVTKYDVNSIFEALIENYHEVQNLR